MGDAMRLDRFLAPALCACLVAAAEAAPRPAPFVGIVKDPYGGATRMGCIDARSLRPVSWGLTVGEYHNAWSRSPDRRRVAIALSAPGRGGRVGVRIVDLARGTVERDVQTGIAADGLAWPRAGRLVAHLLDGRIALIDPATGAVVREWAGRRGSTAGTRRRLAVLERGGRRARLTTVDARGRLRSVSFDLPQRSRSGRRIRAALVAHPSAERAYVLAGRTAVVVDLRRMRARVRRVAGRVPAATRDREALWLGGGRVAVWGHDAGRAVRPGVRVVDIRRRRARRLDARGAGAAFGGGRLITHGAHGVRVHSPDGRGLFDVLRGRTVWSVGVRGRLAHAATATATYVVDLRTRRTVRKLGRPRELAGVIADACPG